MLLPILKLCLLGYYLFCPAASALTLEDLFHVSVDESYAGNCADQGLSNMEQYVSEGISLAQAGLDFVAAATDSDNALHVQAVRLGDAWFREPDLDDYESIEIYYQNVRDFLDNGGGVNGAQPYLFCTDSWALRKDMSSDLLDAQGNPVLLENGDTAKISSSQGMVEAQETATDNLGQEAYPWWSSSLLGYTFMPKYGDLPTQGLCWALDNLYGYTASPGTVTTDAAGATAATWIVLCDSTLSGLKLGAPTCNYANINDWDADNQAFPEGTGTINDLGYDGGVFFHELIHLLEGYDNTVPKDTPNGGEIYGLWEMLGLYALPGSTEDNQVVINNEQAMSNPETYMRVALAWYYTSQESNNVDGSPVEFYTGWCTYGEFDTGSDASGSSGDE